MGYKCFFRFSIAINAEHILRICDINRFCASFDGGNKGSSKTVFRQRYADKRF